MQAASGLESATREQGALLTDFPLAAIHMENLFFKIKQKIFLKDDVILIEDYLIVNYEFTAQVEKHLHRRRISYRFKPCLLNKNAVS